MKEPWYKRKYGWGENPFSVKPKTETFIHPEGVKERCIDYIQGGNVFLLFGQIGTGKTTLFKYLANNFDDKNFIIEYLDATVLEKDDLEPSVMYQFKKKYRRDLKRVLLIDEAQELDKKYSKILKNYFDNDEIYSIGFASLDKNLDFSESFLNRKGKRDIQMSGMSEDQARRLIEKRLDGEEIPFSDDVFSKIYEMAGSPRNILSYCETVCMEVEDPENVDVGFVENVIEVSKAGAQESGGKAITASQLKESLTPTQVELVEALRDEKDLTAKEIYRDYGIGGSEKSVVTQLARLSDPDRMEERGIPFKLVVKDDSGKPHVFNLGDAGRQVLAED